MQNRFRSLPLVLAVLLVAACERGTDMAAIQPALAKITADGMLADIRRLSSDGFEGRAPGTAGEDSTVAYLTSRFREIGLAPGNPDGTWIQNVGLIGFRSIPSGSFRIAGKTIALHYPDDFVAVSRRDTSRVDVTNSELVFVGYGVDAPEYRWNDYHGEDMRGKTLVMLVNDPPVVDPKDSSQLDSTMFRGKAMTYYGRWTYKYEIASRLGAAAAIIVHETGPAGYPWEVVKGSWSQENFDIDDGSDSTRVPVEAWITEAKARELFAAAGRDFDAVKAMARTRDFVPLPLFGRATLHVRNTVRRIRSRNIVAKLEGSDPSEKNQYVVYSAHWDHLGRDTTLKGDQIFNGALDNASGTAALLALATAYKALPTPPRRSVLFLSVTAEEKGLLGAKYYAEHPLYPLDKTLADINIDGVNQWGPTKDIVVVGLGNSSLDDDLRAVASANGRTIVPDPEPEKGYFYRSDHFEFAKKGVPALYTDAGVDFIGKPPGYGRAKRDEYTNNDYHKPSDEVKPDWDLSGAVQDIGLLFEVGYRVAQASQWPTWAPGTEFKAVRDSMLAATGR